MTGQVRGGVKALGLPQQYPVYLDASARPHAVLSVSAGVQGTHLLLAPEDYVRRTGAVVAPVPRHKA